MLKILNNDKFTTAQNRHSLVSLKIPILNTLPVRAKVKVNRSPILLPLQGVGVYTLIPRALPWAMNWLPFQGAIPHIRFATWRRNFVTNFSAPTL